ncbi:hypothetical protein SGCZBJ_04600 [Caulobacter zeae]|uniref:Uncharacterized protein n=1 Tax=Caulobacter zeae TaxID=2055137 RepID=A0A2N5DQF3_9CAUL|nr:hypothetical protein [Caulobacter zeae]PLR28287.1 hypothetical protein SGCZBJ_04600 [Caulobacter zeae]
MADLLPLKTLLDRGANREAVLALEQLAAERHALDDAAFRAPPEAHDNANVPVVALDEIVHRGYGYRAGDAPKTLKADFAVLSELEAPLIIALAAAAADHPTAEQPSRKYLVGLDRAASTHERALVRIDIRTWVLPLDSAHPLSNDIRGLLVVSAARSFVDIKKTPLNAFIAIYQRQSALSKRPAQDVMDTLHDIQHVWARSLERLQA